VLPRLIKDKGAKTICINYQDDEFGLEVLRGAEAGLKEAGLALAERASFKRGATDFSSQVARLKAANCDLVVLGTVIRETIGTLNEAQRTDFQPTFLGSVASYSDVIHKLGGKAANGYYATMTVQTPYLDEAAQPIRFWANKYKTRFGEDPSVFSVYGYQAVDLFIKGAQKAGRQLSTDSFVRAMDTLSAPPDIFGGPELSFSPSKRLGNNTSRLSQIQDGRWKVVSGYIKP
jgi:branched-chain amino acid transport system substrate-binding protein